MRQKVFDGKSWYSPPPFIHKLFRYRKFSETQHRRLPVRNFSALWDKKFSTENFDTTSPLSYSNFFGTRNQCNSKGFPYGNFRHYETKNFRRKILILPPPSLIQTFSVPEINATVKDSPTEIFGTVRQKIFDGKSWYSLPPLLSINFFATGKFLKHSTEGFLYEIFRYCKTKIFQRKIVIPFA